MPRRQAAGMNFVPSIRMHRHWLVAGLLASLLVIAMVITVVSPSNGAGMRQQFNTVVHWRSAASDWLFVVDRQTGQTIVYDATDGRPLCRLDTASDGVLKTCSRDLLEAGDGQADFRLPSSQRMASSAR